MYSPHKQYCDEGQYISHRDCQIVYKQYKQYCDEGQYISHRDCQIVYSLAEIDGNFIKIKVLIDGKIIN